MLKSGKHIRFQQEDQVLCTKVHHKVKKLSVFYTNKSITGQKTKIVVHVPGPWKTKGKSLQHEEPEAQVTISGANSPVAAAKTLSLAGNKNENG